MNSGIIKKAVTHIFSNYDYKLYNTYIFEWESDFFAISKSGYSIEVEIKISRSDFKNDFTKTTRANIKKHDYISDNTKLYKPNKFYFAVPKGLITSDDIPKGYGLIYIENNLGKIIQNAKFIHKNEILKNHFLTRRLLDKFYYRNIDLMIRQQLNQADLKYGQTKLDFYKY
jgi:hypothetical protein